MNFKNMDQAIEAYNSYKCPLKCVYSLSGLVDKLIREHGYIEGIVQLAIAYNIRLVNKQFLCCDIRSKFYKEYTKNNWSK